jgi:hypothetical protein
MFQYSFGFATRYVGSFRLHKMHKWNRGIMKILGTAVLTFLGSRKKKGGSVFLRLTNKCSNIRVCHEEGGLVSIVWTECLGVGSFRLSLQPHLLSTAFQLGLNQIRNSASLAHGLFGAEKPKHWRGLAERSLFTISSLEALSRPSGSVFRPMGLLLAHQERQGDNCPRKDQFTNCGCSGLCRMHNKDIILATICQQSLNNH